MGHETVAEEPVGKKRMIGAFHKKPVEIIEDEMDRFRIVRILIRPLSDIIFYHIVKDLKHIPGDRFGFGTKNFEKLFKGHHGKRVLISQVEIKVP